MDSRRWDDQPTTSGDGGGHHNNSSYHHNNHQHHQPPQQQHYDGGGGGGGGGYGRDRDYYHGSSNSGGNGGRSFHNSRKSHPPQRNNHPRPHQANNFRGNGGPRPYGSGRGGGGGRSRGRSSNPGFRQRDRSNTSSAYRSNDDLRSTHDNASPYINGYQQRQPYDDIDSPAPSRFHSGDDYRRDYRGGGGGSGYRRHDDYDSPGNNHRSGMQSSSSPSSQNTRITFGDGGNDEDEHDADSLIHSILNEHAAEHLQAEDIADLAPSSTLDDPAVADELLQSICSSVDLTSVGGGRATTTPRPNGGRTTSDSDGPGTPLIAIDPMMSSTAAPATPLSAGSVAGARRSKATATVPPTTPVSSGATAAAVAATTTTSTTATKKLLNQLTRMDKHNLKQMINNPDGKYATALQTQARRKNREETRKQLRIISSMDAPGDVEPDECVDSGAIPQDIFEQIGRVLNVDIATAFPPGDDGEVAVFADEGVGGLENDFLMDRLAEAEPVFVVGDDLEPVVQSQTKQDSSASNSAPCPTVVAEQTPKTMPRRSRTKVNEPSVQAESESAPSSNALAQKSDAVLLTADQLLPPPVEKVSGRTSPEASAQKERNLHKAWFEPHRIKPALMKTNALPKVLMISATKADETQRAQILNGIPEKMRERLLSGVYCNLSDETLQAFRTTERNTKRYTKSCKWEEIALRRKKKALKREKKRGDKSVKKFRGTKQLYDDEPVETGSLHSGDLRSGAAAKIPSVNGAAATRNDSISQEEFNGFSTDGTGSEPTTATTGGRKHIRFGEVEADKVETTKEAPEISEISESTTSPSEDGNAVVEASTTSSKADQCTAIDSSTTAADSTQSSPTHIRFDVAETHVEPQSVESTPPSVADASEPIVVVSSPATIASSEPSIVMPLPIASKPAAEFVECDDGRLAQRLSTSAELRQTLKQVPKHIRTAISKRLKELNDNEQMEAAGLRRSSSSQSTGDIEEDVIDVTPETPSVDLTAMDDADDGTKESAAVASVAATAETTTPAIVVAQPEPEVVVAPATPNANTESVQVRSAAAEPIAEPTVSAPAIQTDTQPQSAINTPTKPIVPDNLPKPTNVSLPAKSAPNVTPNTVSAAKSRAPIQTTPAPPKPTKVVSSKTKEKPASSKSKSKTIDITKTSSKSSAEVAPKPSSLASKSSGNNAKTGAKSTTTKAHSRETSREPSVSRDRSTSVSNKPQTAATSANSGAEQRQWRSPAEKKCIGTQAASNTTATSTTTSTKGTSIATSTSVKSTRPATSATKLTSQKSAVQRPIAQNSAKPSVSTPANNKQSGDPVLMRMKDIDQLLIDTQQEKIQIDEQIMQLQQQKAKIEADQLAWHEERSRLLASLISSGEASQQRRAEPRMPTPMVDVKAQKLAKKRRAQALDSEDESPVKFVRTEQKRRRVRTIEINDDETTSATKSPNTESKQEAKYRRLLPDDQQTNRIMRNPGSVRLERIPIDPAIITSLPLATRSEAVTADDSSTSSLSDSGSLDDAAAAADFDGCYVGHRLLIVYVHIVGRYLLAASEDGNVYKYVWRTGRLAATFAHHKQTVTALTETVTKTILSVSLDGFVRQFNLKRFHEQVEAFNLGEPLQVIAYSWNMAFVGSKNGKIMVLNRSQELKHFKLATRPLCTVTNAIMALLPAKEGARSILIVGARSSDVTVRDAHTGLLLRTIQMPEKTTVYSLLLDEGVVHCGTNHKQMLSIDFVTGEQRASKSLAQGTICIRPYGNAVLLCGCYDGNIYAFDKRTGANICQIDGAGKMLLNFVVVNDKIIAATKNSRSLRMCSLPDAVLTYSRQT